MRYILALFDAPFPLQQALAALDEVDVDRRDVAIVSEFEALDDQLLALGVSPGIAADYAEGVRRGGALVAVRAPTVAAAGIAQLLGLFAPDLGEHQARWRANPALVYRTVDKAGAAAVAPHLGEPEAASEVTESASAATEEGSVSV